MSTRIARPRTIRVNGIQRIMSNDYILVYYLRHTFLAVEHMPAVKQQPMHSGLSGDKVDDIEWFIRRNYTLVSYLHHIFFAGKPTLAARK